jgi:hypothetical protein
MEQVVILLVIGAISLINWLIEKSAKLREEKRREAQAQRPIEPSAPIGDSLSERRHSPQEDQMRELLESFGFPVAPEPSPVPPVQERVIEPLPPAIPVQPVRPTPIVPIRAAAPQKIQRHTANPWAKRLRSPSGYKEAVILSEILGSPRALSPR